MPVGFAIAGLLVFSRMRGKLLLDGLIRLPLVLPPVVVGYLLLLLFGRQGALERLLQPLGIQLVFTWKGAVIGLLLMVHVIRLGMEQIAPQLLNASRTLGAGWFDTLRSVPALVSVL